MLNTRLDAIEAGTILRIKILNQEKETDLSIDGLHKNEDQIMNAINYFSE